MHKKSKRRRKTAEEGEIAGLITHIAALERQLQALKDGRGAGASAAAASAASAAAAAPAAPGSLDDTFGRLSTARPTPSLFISRDRGSSRFGPRTGRALNLPGASAAASSSSVFAPPPRPPSPLLPGRGGPLGHLSRSSSLESAAGMLADLDGEDYPDEADLRHRRRARVAGWVAPFPKEVTIRRES